MTVDALTREKARPTESADAALGGSPRVQLRKTLAALSYDEQQASVAPPPLHDVATSAPIQMAKGSGQPPARVPPGTTDMNAIRNQCNIVVGKPVAVDEGHQILRGLAQGNTGALGPVGVNETLGGAFKDQEGKSVSLDRIEWGLGGLSDGKKAVVIRGQAGEVVWSGFRDLSPLAHSHPREGPEGQDKKLNLSTGAGFPAIVENRYNWENLLPSAADIRFCEQKKLAGHIVHTPYRYHPPSRTVDEGFNRTLPTIDIIIDRAYKEDGCTRAHVRIVSGGLLWEGDLQASGVGISFPVGMW